MTPDFLIGTRRVFTKRIRRQRERETAHNLFVGKIIYKNTLRFLSLCLSLSCLAHRLTLLLSK